MSTSSPVEKTGELTQRTAPTPFLTKTYDLVDDPSSNDMISWNENGNAFVVWKPAEFARDLLPKYFKHNNFSSFIRQLNTYGFRKIVSDRWEFSNDYFRRDEKSLLREIQRRKNAIASSTPSTPPAATVTAVTTAISLAALPITTSSPGNSSEELGGSSNSPTATIMKTDLLEENVRLKEQNSNLRCEIDNLRSLCSNVATMMSNFMPYQSEMYNCGSEFKEVEGGDNGLRTEDDMCPRLFGVAIGAKRVRRSSEEPQDDEMQ